MKGNQTDSLSVHYALVVSAAQSVVWAAEVNLESQCNYFGATYD